MTVELRTPYHDPREPRGDRTGGWGSTRTSVVRPVGNPQQVAVTEVNKPEFYNQANDMQPSRVDPRYGLLHTEPAILKPDRMWAFRWPNVGPYRGMTPQPFAWEKRQMDGLGEVTQEQRDQYRRLMDRANELEQAIREFRAMATTTAQIGELALIEGQFDSAKQTLTMADEMEDQELAMAMTEVDIELEQVAERLQAYEMGGREQTQAGVMRPLLLVGSAAVVIAALWWISR